MSLGYMLWRPQQACFSQDGLRSYLQDAFVSETCGTRCSVWGARIEKHETSTQPEQHCEGQRGHALRVEVERACP